MAHFQNQADGNPIRTDEYGNPVHHNHTLGTGTGAFGTTTGIPGTGLHHGGGHAILHRSGSSSSSSSSSEDDGHGGRRKKGLKQKIKEKLPGGHKDGQAYNDHHSHSSGVSTTTSTGGYGTGQHHQKKGIMDKIKEKLPGQH